MYVHFSSFVYRSSVINEHNLLQRDCDDNGIKNGVAEASIAEIRAIYQDKLHRNDFLQKDEGAQHEE